jgi:hypothetical protein
MLLIVSPSVVVIDVDVSVAYRRYPDNTSVHFSVTIVVGAT